MSPAENKQLVKKFVAAVNARDFEALKEIIAPDFERHCPATPDVRVRSYDDFCKFIEQNAVSFPEDHVELVTLIAEGDLVAYWASYSGTQSGPMGPFPPTGRRAVVEFAGYIRISDGRIESAHLTWDNVDLLAQLGHLKLS